MAAPTDNSTSESLTNLSDLTGFTGEGVIIDIGTGDGAVLGNLRRICAPNALFEIVLGLDPARDQSEIQRLGLEPLRLDYIDQTLVPRYLGAGFEVTERAILPASAWSHFNTSWAKRLQENELRQITYLIGHAV